MRAKPQRRKGLRQSNRAHHNFFASLRLCESKKEKNVFPQFCGTGSRNATGQAAK